MTHPPLPVTSPARQPARGARPPALGPLGPGQRPWSRGEWPQEAKGQGARGQVLAPRMRRAACPGCDIVQPRRSVGMRHPACVIVCDIMCDSGRPPAGTRRGSASALAQTFAEGALLPTLCVLPASKAPPKVSPSDGTRIGPPPRSPALERERRGWCLPADHFLPEALGMPVSVEKRSRLGRSVKEGGFPLEERVSCYSH